MPFLQYMKAWISGYFFAVLIGIAILVTHSKLSEATPFYLDSFSVDLNGQLLFLDEFDDGVAPPDAPNFIPSGPTSYSTQGTFAAGSEAGGKLLLDAEVFGGPVLNNANIPATSQRAQLQTARNTSELSNLGVNDTFKISGVFDLILPTVASENYRIRLVDSGQGDRDLQNDRISIEVRRTQIGNPTGRNGAFADLNGQVVIAFTRADFENDQGTIFNMVPLDLTGNPDQIRLTLEKANVGSTAITASYTYLKNGAEIGTFAIAPDAAKAASTDTTIFNASASSAAEGWTRPRFQAQFIDGKAFQGAAKLTTGSPASISQNVSTGADDFNLSFDYRFESTSGFLDVVLNGVSLGMIAAPGTIDGAFSTANFFVDSSIFGNLTDVTLAFILDGPSGSSILLDNILFPGLINGNFETGNLNGWTGQSTGAGSVGVADLSTVPLPAAFPLLGGALSLLGFFGWRRRRQIA